MVFEQLIVNNLSERVFVRIYLYRRLFVCFSVNAKFSTQTWVGSKGEKLKKNFFR